MLLSLHDVMLFIYKPQFVTVSWATPEHSASCRGAVFSSFVPLWTVLSFPAREAELRQLRKSNMEFEERNAALQKHVESMRTAVEKLEVDVIQERSRNTVLQQHLETLRQALTSSFSTVPLPGETGKLGCCQLRARGSAVGLPCSWLLLSFCCTG